MQKIVTQKLETKSVALKFPGQIFGLGGFFEEMTILLTHSISYNITGNSGKK